ncbi:fimbrial biogenesis chaperone [Lelliottia wanjuensis]|uniref:fimbrial biogenesis chaperone n=2 Tax=Lelliottia wanjuensis TaxID=3050585 RepID=UPI00254DCA69|nr:fimbria/pilus periplasmic chaperone [Lelliottia sp. V89_5]
MRNKFLMTRIIAPSLLMVMFCSAAHAGVIVAGTRFIYDEKTKSLNITVENTDEADYLVKAQILAFSPDQESGTQPAKGNMPFVATPPLFVLHGKRENKIRVSQTDGNLPTDRESVYAFSVTAIPSGEPAPNSVQMAVRSRFKFFYRPSGLKGDPLKAYEQLRWQRSAGQVMVENPTPYYVTLVNLKANGQAVEDAAMLAPFEKRSTDWCAKKESCQIQWQSINDYGSVLPPITIPVTPTISTVEPSTTK